MFDPKRDPKANEFEGKLVEMMPKLKEQQVTLGELEPGMLFRFGDTLGFKSEYHADGGAVEAYCLGSGEMFWGATKTPKDQAALMVTPIDGERLEDENAALRRIVEAAQEVQVRAELAGIEPGPDPLSAAIWELMVELDRAAPDTEGGSS